MSDIIQSDYEQLETIARRFEQSERATEAMLKRLRDRAEGLRGTWKGSASARFQAEMGSDVLPSIQRLGEALGAASATTRQIVAILHEAEKEAAALFKVIPIAVSPWDGGSGTGTQAGGHVLYAQQQNDPVVIEDVKQTELSVFFSQYEDSTLIPPEVLDKYLTDPELMAIQHETIRDLAHRVQAGEAPLTPEALYQLVLEKCGDPLTALIIAHNITKELSRGRSPIGWEAVSRNPLVYEMAGERFVFEPNAFHPDAVSGANGRASIFYAMFSPDALGTDDTGDWYHYFLQAAASYGGASGHIEFDESEARNPLNYELRVDSAVDNIMEQSYLPRFHETDAYRGWRYANALSYLEGVKYGLTQGGTQESTILESTIHRQGALFGLGLMGLTIKETVPWYIPIAGASQARWDFHFPLNRETHSIVTPRGAPWPDEED